MGHLTVPRLRKLTNLGGGGGVILAQQLVCLLCVLC